MLLLIDRWFFKRVLAKIDKHLSQCKTKILSLLTFDKLVINHIFSY